MTNSTVAFVTSFNHVSGKWHATAFKRGVLQTSATGRTEACAVADCVAAWRSSRYDRLASEKAARELEAARRSERVAELVRQMANDLVGCLE